VSEAGGALTNGTPAPRLRGKIVEARGVLIRVAGLSLHIGERVRIGGTATGAEQYGEVVGLEGTHALVLPLQGIHGLSPVCEVDSCGGHGREIDALQARGRVIDGLGLALDGGPPLARVRRPPPAPVPPLQRPAIAEALVTGWRAIDGLLTCGEGQRLGIFAPAGAGKSSLLGSLAQRVQADSVVVGLVGERGREVAEFVQQHLHTRSRDAIVVVATSDRAPAEKLGAGELAARLACQLREHGQHVLLLVDSLTRYARAARELGLALGEPAGRGGFPPSVQSRLSQLVEASGRSARGSISAFYTVLCEEEDDPLAEEVRSLVDGHIHLSSALADAGHFPAIDILRSRSRLFEMLAEPTQREHAARFRHWLARYDELEFLLQVGEYHPGADAEADLAVRHHPELLKFLRQPRDAPCTLTQTRQQLAALFAEVTHA